MRFNLPEKCRIGAAYSVHRFDDNFVIEREARENLRHQVADLLAHERVEKIQTEFTTVYRMDLYVLSPEELCRLIREEAMNMYSLMSFNDKWEMKE